MIETAVSGTLALPSEYGRAEQGAERRLKPATTIRDELGAIGSESGIDIYSGHRITIMVWCGHVL